jgi:hypothetical protein
MSGRVLAAVGGAGFVLVAWSDGEITPRLPAVKAPVVAPR